jgi:hypothetical protein
MINLYTKKFFLGFILIFSFDTVLLTQSLTNKNRDSVNFNVEIQAVESTLKKDHHQEDSIREPTLKIRKDSQENSTTEYFKSKSNSVVLSFFNEIAFYWFHQL